MSKHITSFKVGTPVIFRRRFGLGERKGRNKSAIKQYSFVVYESGFGWDCSFGSFASISTHPDSILSDELKFSRPMI